MEKTVAAVGFCCADVYEKLNKFYPTGNGIDWGVHLARMGVPCLLYTSDAADE